VGRAGRPIEGPRLIPFWVTRCRTATGSFSPKLVETSTMDWRARLSLRHRACSLERSCDNAVPDPVICESSKTGMRNTPAAFRDFQRERSFSGVRAKNTAHNCRRAWRLDAVLGGRRGIIGARNCDEPRKLGPPHASGGALVHARSKSYRARHSRTREQRVALFGAHVGCALQRVGT